MSNALVKSCRLKTEKSPLERVVNKAISGLRKNSFSSMDGAEARLQ